jgi:hypothetical protein
MIYYYVLLFTKFGKRSDRQMLSNVVKQLCRFFNIKTSSCRLPIKQEMENRATLDEMSLA